MQIQTRRPLNRRAVLRGTGAIALGLPWLEAMEPTLGQRVLGAVPKAPPKRFVACCATLGFHTPFLFPGQPDGDFTKTPYMETLAEHRDDLTLISGLSHPNQQGNNGHASELTWLTSAQRPGLAGFKNTISIDQLIADRIGIETRFPYLALSTSGRSLSWTSNGVEIPAMTSPKKLFTSLFVEGSADEIDQQVGLLQRQRSILDTVGERAKVVESRISAQDRQKLDEYLSAVRALESRLQQSKDWVTRPKPKVEREVPTDIENRNDAIAKQNLMYEMIALALQTDSTRTITFQLSGMNAVPVVQGVSNDWHNLSHHGKDPTKIDELMLIEQAEFAAFGAFLKRLASIKEGEKRLLDQSSILFGSNLGNASSHSWKDLPIILAGGGFNHGHYIAEDANENTPLANLFVQIGQQLGIEIDSFGSSTSASLSRLS